MHSRGGRDTDGTALRARIHSAPRLGSCPWLPDNAEPTSGQEIDRDARLDKLAEPAG